MRVSRVIQFANFEKLIGVHILQRLTGAGRPRDIDRGDFGIAQAEVETLVPHFVTRPRVGTLAA